MCLVLGLLNLLPFLCFIWKGMLVVVLRLFLQAVLRNIELAHLLTLLALWPRTWTPLTWPLCTITPLLLVLNRCTARIATPLPRLLSTPRKTCVLMEGLKRQLLSYIPIRLELGLQALTQRRPILLINLWNKLAAVVWAVTLAVLSLPVGSLFIQWACLSTIDPPFTWVVETVVTTFLGPLLMTIRLQDDRLKVAV